MSNDDHIDPLAEFDPCPLSNEGIELAAQTEHYLEEQARPVLTAIKKYGWMIIEGLAKSGNGLGLRPPRQ